MNGLVAFMSGFLVAGYAVAGLFFLRFWHESGDRLFAYFSGAFFLLCLQRVLLVSAGGGSPLLYVVRLVAFTLIIVAFVEKNRAPADQSASK